MLEFNKHSNTLEQSEYIYALQDVTEPHLYRYLFNYEEVPKVPFNHRHVPMRPPEKIWITDSTFRDGQQAREPYTVKQIVDLYKYLHRLGGPKGVIRQTEFFLYSNKDKEAATQCMELGYDYPEITSWIRAVKEDFLLVKEMGLKETGILASCSDYHIFKKLKLTRKQAMEQFLSIVKSALEIGVTPRVHLEDITRADFYGFVVPFVLELMKLQEESKIKIKIRACDTLGFGVNYPGVALPRSVPAPIASSRASRWAEAPFLPSSSSKSGRATRPTLVSARADGASLISIVSSLTRRTEGAEGSRSIAARSSGKSLCRLGDGRSWIAAAP